jgi:plasmid stabilization system protein ParE
MADLIIADAAEAEIDRARDYLLGESVSAAAAFLAEVRHVMRLIAETPEQWPRYGRRHRFFALRKHSYVVYYRILDTDKVRVVAVSHSSRRAGYWKGR